jgi:hypothetical protein
VAAGARPHPERQRKGPLKQIKRLIRRAIGGGYNQALVELECGHIVKTNSKRRARCDRCDPDPKLTDDGA